MTTPSDPRSLHSARNLAVRTDQLLGIDQVLVRAGRSVEPVADRVDHPESTASDHPSSQSTKSVATPQKIIVPTNGTSDDRLACLEQLHDSECPHCTNSDSHRNIVFGEGDSEAELMFVGEAPGVEEDRTGRPFVGRAGQKLDEMIKAMGFARKEVYIANVLKSRPPDNRTPLQHEVDACGPYLAAQVRIVRPTVIVALGGPAAKLLLRTETGITRLRGLWGEYDDGAGRCPVMPTFHPAYLLRNPTREVRGQVWDDLKAVLERLGRPVPGQ